jgi:ribosomal protein S18 acetylase RimI-like enzyme
VARGGITVENNENKIRKMESDDLDSIMESMNEPYMLGHEEENRQYFKRCLQENKTDERVTFIAYIADKVVDYVNIIYKSLYPWFVDNGIPEINDLYIAPAYRKRGIGLALLKKCEQFAAVERGYKYIGLGVGMYKDYGSAQRLYTKNGYVFDGNGLMYKNKEVQPGKEVFVDDDLLIYLYKKIK